MSVFYRQWKKYSLLGWLSALLIIGFIATSLASYLVSRDLVRTTLVDQSLPLTGDNIYSEIQKDVLRPTFISSLMANDTFLRDWIIAGEQDTAPVARYLKEVKEKYGTVTSFLVSDRTANYYYADGILKQVSETEPRDEWYYRVRDMQTPYEMNVDVDMANRDTITIFINYRVLDYDGNFIGATGVGLTIDTLARIIKSVQERFQRNIYFVDAEGDIVVSGQGVDARQGSIYELPGVQNIASDIINNSTEPTQLTYTMQDAAIAVSSRYIPELHWYLVVEQEEEPELWPLQRVFMLNLAVSAAITLLVLLVCLYAVNRFQRRLENVAATDSLTGLLNRQAFEFIFDQAVHEVARSKNVLSALLVDIDHFKKINDTYGHVMGDSVICAVTEKLRKNLRENDVISRWGGEEFFILLKDCPAPHALEIAQKLREAMANQTPIDGMASAITVSIGVAEYRATENLPDFFARADKALYRAKDLGRNRVELG
jgi:diguanylate cyclase (GGDEF)-like protein